MIRDERLDEIISSRAEPVNLFEAREMARELKATRERNRRIGVAVLGGDYRAVYREYTRQYMAPDTEIEATEEVPHEARCAG